MKSSEYAKTFSCWKKRTKKGFLALGAEELLLSPCLCRVDPPVVALPIAGPRCTEHVGKGGAG